MTPKLNGQWDATAFFESLCSKNRLAVSENFTFCKVSGLEGFEEALSQSQSSSSFVCVSDIADGYTELNNTPRTRRVKTVFLAMRHAAEDMDARNSCMEIMRELFRQFMSVLLLERVKLEQNCIYLDPRISFNEIDRYFFTGCACAYFQIAVDVYTDLRYSTEDWGYYEAWFNSYSNSSEKIHILKALMDIFGVRLSDARDIFENAPALIVKHNSLQPIPDITKLTSLGIKIEFR